MGSRTQILKCKVLLKGIEFDFPLCKQLKIDWKLPKYQFSIFFVIRKVKNRIENCTKPIFISLKLLKIENWIKNCQKINFHFFEIIENWTKMKWTFSYTDDKSKLISWNRNLFYPSEIHLLNRSSFYEIEIYLFNRSLFIESKFVLWNRNLFIQLKFILWNQNLFIQPKFIIFNRSLLMKSMSSLLNRS